MTPEIFVSCIRREVLGKNLTAYGLSLERLASTPSGKDTYWPQITELYQSLNEEQRQQLLGAIRQVMVDTLSNVVGILDGSTLLEKHRDYFHLTYGEEPQELNGELQDFFLSPET